MRLASHTIVRNGMPFIVPVLEQVAPYVDKYFIAVSQFSDDGTLEAIQNWNAPKPVEFLLEGSQPKDLTKIRQFQVDRTTQDWTLFLDDDDWWIPIMLMKCLELAATAEYDAISVSPYQVKSKDTYDAWWGESKFFTKLFRNENINYRGDWPKDMIYSGDTLLYHKTNPKVAKVKYGYYHLADVKKWSFRQTMPAFQYGTKNIQKLDLPEELSHLL